MKYPHYIRSQDRRCKLSDKDLQDIKTLHSRGYTNIAIAKRLKVSAVTIRFYVNPKAKIYERNRMRKRYYTNPPSKARLKSQSKLYRKRKRNLQTKKIREYYKERTQLYRFNVFKKQKRRG